MDVRLTPWKPSQPAMKSQSIALGDAVGEIGDRRRVRGDVVEFDVGRPRRRSWRPMRRRRRRGRSATRSGRIAIICLPTRATVSIETSVVDRSTRCRSDRGRGPRRPSAHRRRAARSVSTVLHSSTPARIRPSTYSRLRSSSTTLSMPARPSMSDSSVPAGPAPMITTGTFMRSPHPLAPSTKTVRRRPDADRRIVDNPLLSTR